MKTGTPVDHGHTITVDGVPVHFDTLFDYCGDYIAAAVVFTHALTDAEVLDCARAYLEGAEWRAEYGDPYNGFGVDAGSWPDPADPSAVRRVWGRWRDAGPADLDVAEYYEGYNGGPVWEESAGPGGGLTTACVVDLAS